MGVQVKSGNNSAGLANVDNNFNLNVVSPQTEVQAGFAQMSSEVDNGIITGTRYCLSPEASGDYRLRVGVDSPLFSITFEGNVFPSGHLTTVVGTGTVTTPGLGYLLLTGGTAINQYAVVRTHRTFPLFGSYQMFAEFWLQEDTALSQSGVRSEWGFGYPNVATGAPTNYDGVYFRRESGGNLYAVLTINGTDYGTGSQINTTNLTNRDGTPWDPTIPQHYVVEVGADETKFWINDHLVCTIQVPSSAGFPGRTSSQQIFSRIFNSGGSTARTLKIYMITGSMGDINSGKPWSHIMAGQGAGAYQLPFGAASGPTVIRSGAFNNWPASGTARTTTTWTATSAPATNSLGGIFLTPGFGTLAADADYPIFAFLNAFGTTANPGKNLYITNIRVGEAYGTTAALAGATFGTMMNYITAVGSLASTLATTDSTTVTQPRGIVLGGHGWSATEVQVTGSTKPGFETKFDSPLVVPPGTYWHFVARPCFPVAGNAFQYTSSVAVNGYYE